MAYRTKNVLLCLAALFLGGLLYVFFRPNTHIAGMFAFLHLPRLCASDFFKFYLPDFLWALSLSCGFIAIYCPKKSGVLFCAVGAFLFGLVWELLQYIEAVSGTADIHDIIMYFFASAICITINLKGDRNNEKT